MTKQEEEINKIAKEIVFALTGNDLPANITGVKNRIKKLLAKTTQDIWEVWNSACKYRKVEHFKAWCELKKGICNKDCPLLRQYIERGK